MMSDPCTPTVLVTGGAGYIGSHTAVVLQQSGYRVVIVDNLSNAEASVIDRITRITGIRPDFVQADCKDKAALCDLFASHPHIDHVIHFAAFKAVGESIDRPLDYYRNNLTSLLNLLEIMPEYDCHNIVFSSSATVYGQPDQLPVDENAPFKPAYSPYGATKQICESILKDTANAAKGNLRCVSLRYFNPIGAHPSALIGESPRGVPQNLIPYLTQSAAGLRGPLQVFGNDYHTPDGYCIRDYIYVMDLANAHMAALSYLSNPDHPYYETFNLGTGKGWSVMELIREFENATGVPVPHAIAPRRLGDIEQVWANPDKARRLLHWTADTPMAQVLRTAWEWQRRNL